MVEMEVNMVLDKDCTSVIIIKVSTIYKLIRRRSPWNKVF